MAESLYQKIIRRRENVEHKADTVDRSFDV